MKKTLFKIVRKSLFVCCIFSSYAAWAQSGEATVTGELSGAGDQKQVFIIYGDIQDSVKLTEGRFSYTTPLQEPQKAYLLVGNTLRESYRGPRLTFYLEPGAIQITGASASLSQATVVGGDANGKFKEYNALMEPAAKLSDELNTLYRDVSKEEQESEAFQAKAQAKRDALQEQRRAIARQFIQTNPGSIVSLDAIVSSSGFDPEIGYVEPLFQMLSPVVKSTDAGKQYADQLEIIRKTSIGVVAPDFTQADTAGKMVSLSGFRGQYVLLDFWASWCGPCRAENPHVVAAFNQYKDKGFTVLGVSLDDEKDRDKWIQAIHDDGLQHWTQVSDLKGWKNAASQLYGVRGIPTNYLIDPTGKIIAKNLRGKALIDKLAEIM